jgi:hypothetical protein
MVRAPVLCVPLTGCVPLQPPEAVHDVALVELHVKVDALPLATDAGDAVKVTVGMMLTVTLELELPPPGPAQLKE